MPSDAFNSHDHPVCIRDGLKAAERHCAEAGLQFTSIRRRVLEILLSDHKPLGAYDILDRLRDDGLNAQPPMAYRALDFLVTHGFAHRIERLNAFIACTHKPNVAGGEPHTPAFLICRSCQRVVETDAPARAGELGRAARQTGFVIERTIREAEGLCLICARANA